MEGWSLTYWINVLVSMKLFDDLLTLLFLDGDIYLVINWVATWLMLLKRYSTGLTIGREVLNRHPMISSSRHILSEPIQKACLILWLGVKVYCEQFPFNKRFIEALISLHMTCLEGLFIIYNAKCNCNKIKLLSYNRPYLLIGTNK